MPILTAAQAQQAIQTVNTQAEFYNVFNSVDVSASGGTTILYSGRLGDLESKQYANASATAQGARILDKTQAFNFIENNIENIKQAAQRVGLSAEATDNFLNGTGPDSAWGGVSKRFVDAAPSGTKITTFTTDADFTRVFARSEVEAIFNNPNITEVNGLSRTSFTAAYNAAKLAGDGTHAAGLEGLKQAFTVTSADNIYNQGIGNYKDPITGETKIHVPGGGGALPEGARVTIPNPFANFIGREGNYRNFVNGANIVKGLGRGGTFLGMALAFDKAYGEWQAGNSQGALETLGKFVASETGAVLGGAIATRVAGLLFRGMLAAGIGGGALVVGAGAVTLAAAVVASIALAVVFEKAVEYVYDLVRPDVSVVNADPLVIDLNGDGVRLTGAAASGVFFDIDKDNVKESVGWVSAQDGLVARDLNNNGKIDDIGELIGTATQDAYSFLRTYDTNNDRKINASDAIFATLKIWQDANVNGVTDAGELRTLTERGVTEISLNDTLVLRNEASGNYIYSNATATVYGAERETKAVFFQTRQEFTQFAFPAGYTPHADTVYLPDLSGGGNVTPLSYAMTNNASCNHSNL